MFLNSEKMLIGYDLSKEYAQISFCKKQADEPETFSVTEGTECYNIPACLFKLESVNQWFFGKDAITYSEVEKGVLFTSLLENAIEGTEITIAEEKFDSAALLALFIKRSLSMLDRDVKKERIDGIMFSVPTLTQKSVEALKKIRVLLDMPECDIHFQSREESIFSYMIHQPEELLRGDVMVYDLSLSALSSYCFMRNRNTTPVVAFVKCEEYGSEGITKEPAQDKDETFLQIVRRSMDGKEISSVYLIGEGFDGNWCQESLREICRGRRAFQGNNLYSKGACYALMELFSKTKKDKILFLGKEKLKANVGMNVMRNGEESYLALLNGGENWYEEKKECDIILTEGNSFSLKITPLDGRNVKDVEIVLDGLPKRENKMTRLHLNISMVQEELLLVRIADMGFGEFEPSSKQNFEQQIVLS